MSDRQRKHKEALAEWKVEAQEWALQEYGRTWRGYEDIKAKPTMRRLTRHDRQMGEFLWFF